MVIDFEGLDVDNRRSIVGFLIILRLGVVDRYLNFKLNDLTSVYKSCTATMNGDTFVFGGHFDDGEKSNTKQVSHPRLKVN